HQNLIWARTRHTNALRSALREYYPAALQAFDNLADRDALAVLGRAPSPVEAARLSLAKVRSALKHAGRQRNLDARAQEITAALRTEQLTAPAAITAAFAATTRAAVGIIAELNRQISELEAELATHFEAHPDADIYLSLPGLGVILGARVLGEFGDDPNRYTTAKSRKNYAGTSPLTVASGKKRAILARRVRNRRLYAAIDQWALGAINNSPGARTFYDQHRAAGDLHHPALRALGNRLGWPRSSCPWHPSPDRPCNPPLVLGLEDRAASSDPILTAGLVSVLRCWAHQKGGHWSQPCRGTGSCWKRMHLLRPSVITLYFHGTSSSPLKRFARYGRQILSRS
ncbi:MAG: hypothetical protein QOD10_1438, partial [Mycobacterium sp.]|nr:hypothetical protein [Mycobacterium sp.]